MLSAPIFAVAAGVVALVYPEALVNRWHPATLAITHLLTLGFITMVMVGALQQLLPVLAGVNLSYPVRTSWVLYIGLLSGTIALCGGFLFMMMTLIAVGAALLAAAFLLLIIVFLHALLRSDASINITMGMRLALISFLITISLGVYLATGYVVPGAALHRTPTDLHIEWGLLGWIGLLVFTVSYQVIPMFQVTPKYPERMQRYLAPLVFIGLVVVSAFRATEAQLVQGSFVSTGIEFGLMVAFTFYALVTLGLQQRRRRKVPDVTMDFWRLGLSFLLLAILVSGAARAGVISHPLAYLVLGALMIVGFAMSLINGMLYKIIPFLVWLHLTNTIDMSSRWQLKIPNMKKIVPDKHARGQFRAHLAAVLLILAAIPMERLVPVAAVLFVGSNLYLSYNLVKGAAVFWRFSRQAEE